MTLLDLSQKVVGIINSFVPIVMGAALLYFLWGVTQYVIHSGDEKKRSEAVQVMTWGLIGLFVMVAVWGLVNVLKSTFTLNYDQPIAPQFH